MQSQNPRGNRAWAPRAGIWGLGRRLQPLNLLTTGPRHRETRALKLLLGQFL